MFFFKFLVSSLFHQTQVFFFPIYFHQLEANYFTILQWFLSYIDMNQPWIYMHSPSRSPLPPPSLPDPSVSSQCRIDIFELWCWRKLLRISWMAKRSNQLILNEISPEYSLEGLMLKLQYFGHLIQYEPLTFSVYHKH